MKDRRILLLSIGLIIPAMISGASAYTPWVGVSMARPVQIAADTTETGLPMDVKPEDMVLGRADAPVTIIEYASLTCSHCGAFHRIALPQIKTEFIDRGKVRLVYRDFPLDGAALDAAALAHCAPDHYFELIGTMYEKQRQWAVEASWREHLTEIAATFGMSKVAVDACLNDDARIDAVLAERQEGEAKYGVTSTPTFIINGRKIKGAQTVEQLADYIKQAEQPS